MKASTYLWMIGSTTVAIAWLALLHGCELLAAMDDHAGCDCCDYPHGEHTHKENDR